MQNRTNNALVQTFGVNNRNELTNATRSGTLTVAGLASQPGANLDHVAVSGTGLSSGNANVYADGSWARAGATVANGTNSYTATAEDTYGRTAQDSVSVNLPATVTFTYDANGNLTGDGRRVFEYDYENQLTNVYVASAWRESMRYDAFGRKRVLQQHRWTGSAWLLTNEVRYVYDGMLVVQERHFQPQVSTNIPINTISYTRGNDLSGSLQGAGGIGGLLARTDHSAFSLQHSYFHSDGNGNITALVNTNGVVVARYSYDPYGNLLGMAGPLAEANTYRFSSKEWHANAGLYYYGFRYYEPNLQRWLNRDPIQEEGGLNLYELVGSDPCNDVDPFGLWPSGKFRSAKVHQASIDRVLNFLSEEDRDILKKQQEVADEDQSPECSYKHAMRSPDQTVSEAKELANDFVQRTIKTARSYEKKGQRRDALEALGDVMHLLQDATSPAHSGFQEWKGLGVKNLRAAKKHADRENYDPGPNSDLDAATLKAWQYFTGEIPVPKDCFK